MADEEHLAIFKKGVESWNEWRSSRDPRNGGDGTLIFPDLSGVNFSGYYDDFDLSSYDFTETNLSETYLSEANLSEAHLWGANLSEAHLWGANLSKANLIGTKLTKAILNDAILNTANLIEAELSKAELVRTQALGTNFERATFTGACIEDWNINSATNLNGVICDYIYLKGGEGAAEIQQLLKQLEQTNPGATEAEKKAYVTASVPPTFRARTVSALKAGGKEALKELLDNPYVNTVVAIVEGWQSPE